MALMGSQSQMLHNQGNSLPYLLRDHHTCDGQGMEMHYYAFLLPGMKMQPLRWKIPSTHRELREVGKEMALDNLPLFPGEDIYNYPDAVLHQQ